MEGGCGKQDYGACKNEECAKCIARDYARCPNKVGPCFRCSPGSDSFTCTIAVVNSAILKLSKVTPLPKGGLLYRGINFMSFPDSLLEMQDKLVASDSHVSGDAEAFVDTIRGFVEFGECAGHRPLMSPCFIPHGAPYQLRIRCPEWPG